MEYAFYFAFGVRMLVLPSFAKNLGRDEVEEPDKIT